LYMIAGLYLVLPMIKVFTSKGDKNLIKYMLVLLFIFNSLIPYANRFFELQIGIMFPMASVFIFYLILGYYIHYYNIVIKKRILLCMFAVYLLFYVLASIKMYNVNVDWILGDPASPLNTLAAMAVFCFVRQTVRSSKFCDFLAPLCFGIYIVHMIFINFIYKALKFTPDRYNLILVVLVTFFATTVLSILTVYLLRKIEFIRKHLL
jgi:surface polysaccharide O-acyltransferase-like enzyme